MPRASHPELLDLSGGPGPLLASLPAALGRELAPYDLLLIGVRQPGGGLPSRIALAELSPDENYSGRIYRAVDALDEHGCTDALLIEHSGRHFAELRDSPPGALALAADFCNSAGIRVREAVTVADRAGGCRWRSLACTIPTCCPPEGRAIPETGANPS
jgi:hypothetical protein